MSLLPKALEALISHFDPVIVINEAGILLQKNLSKTLTLTEDKTVDSHTVTLEVSKDYSSDKPFNIVCFADEKAFNLHLNISIKAHTHLKLYEHYYTQSSQVMKMTTTIVLEAHSSLKSVLLSEGLDKTTLEVQRQATLKEQASIDVTQAFFTGQLTHQNHHIHLNGTKAYATSKTMVTTTKKSEALLKTTIEHNAPHTQGTIEHYGVALDDSMLVFEGVGHIHKGMIKSIARQTNKGIIQGANARLDANPLLLIDEYDVEASHGAAIGQIDENQLYYLMSRGLMRKEAERLIINGYFAPLREDVDQEVLSYLDQKLLTTFQ